MAGEREWRTGLPMTAASVVVPVGVQARALGCTARTLPERSGRRGPQKTPSARAFSPARRNSL